MNGIADVMGLPVNVITEREFVGLVNAYLRNDVMNVVYMISVDTLSYMYVRYAGNFRNIKGFQPYTAR